MIMKEQWRRRIIMLLEDMREAKAQADKADKLWNELNEAFKVKVKAENARRKERGRPPKTDALILEERQNSIALSDAFGVQGWWQAKAEACATMVLAEKAVYDMYFKEG